MFGHKSISIEILEEVEEVCDEIDSKTSLISRLMFKTVISNGDVDQKEEIVDEEDNQPVLSGIRANYPFKEIFESILTEEIQSIDNDVNEDEMIENEDYNPSLFKYFNTHYLSLLPILSLAVVPSEYNGEYPTNQAVENYVKTTKNNVLHKTPLKLQQPIEFLRSMSEYNKKKILKQKVKGRKRKNKEDEDKWLARN